MSRLIAAIAVSLLMLSGNALAALQPNGGRIVVEQATDQEDRARVSIGSDGKIAVVWARNPVDDSEPLFVRFYEAAGQPLTQSISLSGGSDNGEDVFAASLGTAGFAVTYSTVTDDQHQLFLRLYDSAGVLRTGPILLDSFIGDDGIQGGAISANSTGDFVVSWLKGARESFIDGDQNGTAFVRKFNSDGQALTPIINIANVFQRPWPALSTTGDFVLAYVVGTQFENVGTEQDPTILLDESQLFARRYNGSGTQLGMTISVDALADDNSREEPVSAYSPDGARFAVTWVGPDDRPGGGDNESIKLRFYSSDGTGLGSTIKVVPSQDEFEPEIPSVAFTSATEAVVLWTVDDDENNSNDGLFFRTFGTDGTPTAASVRLSSSDSAQGFITSNRVGSSAAAWAEGNTINLQRYVNQQGGGGGGGGGGGADTTPDQFVFVDKTDVTTGTLTVSDPVTITGINTSAAISVTGGDYSINDGMFTAAEGFVSNGDKVKVRHTSSSNNGVTTNTVLLIGVISDAFSSTTGPAADINPNAFNFTDQNGVTTGSTVTSNTITVAGLGTNLTAPIGVSGTGGRYRVNTGGFVTTSGTVRNGDTVTVQHIASGSASTATNTILTIGQVSDTFTSVTANPQISIPGVTPADTAPNPFTFMDQVNVGITTERTSNTITIAGIGAAASVSVTGGSYSINGGTFVTSAGTVSNGNTIAVRHTSAATFDTVINTMLTVGGVSDTFSSQTISPDPAVGNSTSTTDSAGRPVTFTQNNGVLVELMRVDAPAQAPTTFTYPNGFYSFKVTGVGAGGSTTVVLTLPQGSTPTAYIKCTSTSCSEFSNAIINGNVVTLTLTDGDAFDTDPAAGVIGDPGAPAVAAGAGGGGGGSSSGGSGGGGCAYISTGQRPKFDPTLLLLAILGLLSIAYRKRSLREMAY